MLCLLLTASALFGCSRGKKNGSAPNYKIGLVLIGDENSCQSNAHIRGIRNACAALGLDKGKSIIMQTNVPGDEHCYEAIVSCLKQGCTLVITDDASHERYTMQAASEYPEFQFVAIGGSSAKSRGLANFHNASAMSQDVYYTAGVVAGKKLLELEQNELLTEENLNEDGTVKVGFVGYAACAEVISDYTAFYLGIRSVKKDAAMFVQYTNARNDPEQEYEAAMSLIERGCVILGQHTDSDAPAEACQQALDAGMCVYCVGGNYSQPASAPDAFLVSAMNDWESCYTYILNALLGNGQLDADWIGGFAEDAVDLSARGDACAEGSQEAAAETIAKLKDETIHVFAISKFTVKGKAIESAFVTDSDADGIRDTDEAIFDGYFHERYFSSGAAFDLRIDGISELN